MNQFCLRAIVNVAVFSITLTIAQGQETYAQMLEQLRPEIAAKLPQFGDATRRTLEEAKDSKARVEAVKQIAGLEKLLGSDALDAELVKFSILYDATPAGLAEYAAKGTAQKALIDYLLANEKLMLQITIADGATPVHAKRSRKQDRVPGNYGRVMEIYSAIRKESPKSQAGLFQRLALAVSLEYSESDVSETSKAVQRYLHYKTAYEAGELDPLFDSLTTWELRFVVCAPDSDEALVWGREMLRNFRPDHIYTENEAGRYVGIVGTDVRYGSLNVGNDREEFTRAQNVLMNGGICGRRAYFVRFICYAFGVPATPRPSGGHGASARRTSAGWVVIRGPKWGDGWTTTRYRKDLDFLATTQARARGKEFLKVKRAYWLGDVMGEKRCYAEFDEKAKPNFWNAVALATQRRIIEESKAVTLDALGADLGEADGLTIAEKVIASDVTPDVREIKYGSDGAIIVPAAAYAKTEENANDVIAMKSFAGGMQVFLPRFFQQEPILVRGGSIRHPAELCASATRHWRGRRSRKSQDLRGIRLAVTPEEDQPAKEMTLDLGDGVTMDFVYIPPGTFMMGGDREKKAGDILADTPRHEVTLTKGFYLGKYEVTQAQYKFNMSRGVMGEHPVDAVKPFTVLAFCDGLSERTGLDVRLPTEAEWEYAARAGTDTRWFFGDDPSKLGEYAWFKDNAERKSHPVGQKKPNPWGLYDIYGNVAEYVRDEHSEDYYAKSAKVDPIGPMTGIHSSMKYTVEVPKAGAYTLTAQVVTPNVEQSLQLAVNGSESALNIELPFTIGAWGKSKPVTVTLNQGINTLHFWRDQAPQYGAAVKSFTLKPAGANM